MSNTWKDFVTNTIIGTAGRIPLDLPDAVAATLDAPIVARQGRHSRSRPWCWACCCSGRAAPRRWPLRRAQRPLSAAPGGREV